MTSKLKEGENRVATNRKLGRTTDIRMSMLRTLTTDLLLHGKVETTEARAKEVKAIADSLISLAIKEKDNFETVEVKVVKAKLDSKGGTAVDHRQSGIQRHDLSAERRRHHLSCLDRRRQHPHYAGDHQHRR